MPIAPALDDRARAAADLLRDHGDRKVTVVHHIDADGVSAGAIALEGLARAGIKAEALHVKSLDAFHIEKVKQAQPEALWFCDLGSTAYPEFQGVPKVVCDHHELVRDGGEDFQGHVNPLLDDLPGTDVSGAGACFLVARALVDDIQDLLPMALVGAAADLQDREHGHFEGSNVQLLADAQAAGIAHIDRDLAFYGPATRPIVQYLAYAKEHAVPGITGDRRGAETLLGRLGIQTTGDDGPRTWLDLADDERRAIRSAVVQRALDCGLPTDSLWRDVVTLPKETPHTPLVELQEFGTLLNATARYDRPDVGLAVARGDRDAMLREALDLREGHRRHLGQALDVLSRSGIQEEPTMQWVHAKAQVRDTVIGIVCGMALDGLDVRKDLPLIGLAYTPDGRTKVSARAPAALQSRGVDLAHVMREAAAAVGGQGGGHKGAAGATIPRDQEAAFRDHVAALLSGKKPAKMGVVFDTSTTQH